MKKLHSGFLFHVDDAVLPIHNVVMLHSSTEFLCSDYRGPWSAGQVGFVVSVEDFIDETGEVLLLILSPYHLGWTNSWCVQKAF